MRHINDTLRDVKIGIEQVMHDGNNSDVPLSNCDLPTETLNKRVALIEAAHYFNEQSNNKNKRGRVVNYRRLLLRECIRQK